MPSSMVWPEVAPSTNGQGHLELNFQDHAARDLWLSRPVQVREDRLERARPLMCSESYVATRQRQTTFTPTVTICTTPTRS